MVPDAMTVPATQSDDSATCSPIRAVPAPSESAGPADRHRANRESGRRHRTRAQDNRHGTRPHAPEAKPITTAGRSRSDQDWDHLGSYGRDPLTWDRFRRRDRIRRMIFGLDAMGLLLAFAAVPAVNGGWELPYLHVVEFFGWGPAAQVPFYILLCLAIYASWLGLLINRNLYDADVFRDRTAVNQRILGVTASVFGVPAFIAATVGSAVMRDLILISLPFGLAWLYFSHFFVQKILRRINFGGVGARQLVVVTREQYAKRDQPRWRQVMEQMALAGYVVLDGDRTQLLDTAGNPVEMGCPGLCADSLEHLSVDEILVMCPGAISGDWLRRMNWACSPMDVSVYLYPNLQSVSPSRVRASRIHGMAMMKISISGNIAANGLAKRAIDVIVASLLVLVLSPLLLATAAAVKLGDGGPIFYRAGRIGRHGEEFTMWKFRSMAVDADKRKAELIKASGQSDFLFKMKDDPRITRVGKFIRRYSIDELPQLFNVIGGTMSLVGPRPQVAAERDCYDDDAWMRLTVRPGMTGLWQVSGRSNLSGEESIALDLLYIDNWSPALDISILLRTFTAVVGSEGAY